jgi:RimJ/RimL family protein N-acetyltransferase
MDLRQWKGCARPTAERLEGRYVVLERLDIARHGDGLFSASTTADAAERFRYLFEYPPESREAFEPWLEKAAASTDPLFFAVIERASGTIAGRQALMRIDMVHGVIEIGSILWNGLVARRPAATEAQYLFMRHAFRDLGYRRYEWKCNDLNEPSKRAAIRFGFSFEGVFRQHMVAKGENRDTAWFSVIDSEWPALETAYGAWLDPSNFDVQGNQRQRLADLISVARQG